MSVRFEYCLACGVVRADLSESDEPSDPCPACDYMAFQVFQGLAQGSDTA